MTHLSCLGAPPTEHPQLRQCCAPRTQHYAAQDCSLARALEVIGERWTLLIVRDAVYGVRRFNDF